MPKTLTNTLPDEPVCDCDGATPRQMLDRALADFQRRVDDGECLRSLYLELALGGLIAAAMIGADDTDLLPDTHIAELGRSLIPHVTQDLMVYLTMQVADIWDAPAPEARN